MSDANRETRIVEVMAKAVQWFDFDESDDISASLSKVMLAQLRAKGYEVVYRGFPAGLVNHETCVIHLAPRAAEEDRRVCWEYDGKDDCLFTSTPEADAVLRKVAEHIKEER